MIAELTEIFQYGFMNRAFVVGIAVAVMAPLVGFFLVIRRFSMLVDTLSHVSLIGVATALLFQFSPVVGAVIASVLAGISMDRLRSQNRIFSDTILAIFLSGSLALTLILFSLGGGLGTNIFIYLFGSITTVSVNEVYETLFAGVLVTAVILVIRRKLFLISYDEDQAKISGINTGLYNLVLMVLVGVVIALSIKAIGALLIGALMIIPVASAIQLNKGMTKTILFSIIFSIIAVISGLYLSFYFDLPSSAVIVLCLLLIFTLSFFAKRKLD